MFLNIISILNKHISNITGITIAKVNICELIKPQKPKQIKYHFLESSKITLYSPYIKRGTNINARSSPRAPLT